MNFWDWYAVVEWGQLLGAFLLFLGALGYFLDQKDKRRGK